jgi:uncharacterized DUF497 family protein
VGRKRRRKRRPPKRKVEIRDWDVDDHNIEELANHGVSLEVVEAVATNRPRFRRNKKRRAATHQMIGPDEGGSFWVVCIRETGPSIWRPITGWPAGGHEIEWWRRSR